MSMNKSKFVKNLSLIAIVFGIAFLSAQASADNQAELKTDKDRVNYAIGVNFIYNLRLQGVDVDIETVIRGMKDAAAGGQLLLTDDELAKAVKQYQIAMRQKRSQVASKAAEANSKAGEAFLAENAKKEGVVVLPSGLQYKVLKTGSGKKPAEGNTVECHYRGTLITGSEFDSTYRNGKPAILKMSEIIPGLREALQLMPTGSKWQVFIPHNLAYGVGGAGIVKPNSTLIFEIELLDIK